MSHFAQVGLAFLAFWLLFSHGEKARRAFCLAEESVETPEWIELSFPQDKEIFDTQTPITVQFRLIPIPRVNAFEPDQTAKTAHLTISLYPMASEKEGDSPWGKRQTDKTKPLGLYEQEVPLLAANASQSPWIPITFPPVAEGAYGIVATLQIPAVRPTNALFSLPNQPFQRRQFTILAEKTISCVVLAATSEQLVAIDQLELLETFDLVNPAWWKRLTMTPHLRRITVPELPRINLFRESLPPAPTIPAQPHLPTETFDLLREVQKQYRPNVSEPFGSGHIQQPAEVNRDRFAVNWVTLESAEQDAERNADQKSLPSWQALPLPVTDTNVLHQLNIEYDANWPQTLGICIVEFLEHDGIITPCMTAQSGLHKTPDLAETSGNQTIYGSTHTISFWPKTSQPLLLLTNLGENGARFGKIRLYRNHKNFSKTTEENAESSIPVKRRLVAGYWHALASRQTAATDYFEELLRPLEIQASGKQILPDDWMDLFQTGQRMIKVIEQNQQNGLMLPVASHRLCLFPSDKWPQNATHNATVRDALELWSRLFDRQDMTLIHAFRFDMPLREIEEWRLKNPLQSDALGRTTAASLDQYNLLHPVVQEAMLNVVREHVQRYGNHASFGGVSIILDPESCAVLSPRSALGMEIDDVSFTQFLADLPDALRAEIPPELLHAHLRERDLTKQMAARSEFLRSHPPFLESWLRWRTEQVRQFYARMAAEITALRPDAKLYLAGATMLDHPDLQPYCVPAILPRSVLLYPLRLIGFDLNDMTAIPSLVFLRPERSGMETHSDIEVRYADFKTQEMGNFFVRNPEQSGALFFRDGERGKVTLPAGAQNRRRFVKQLARSDVREFFDGGPSLINMENVSNWQMLQDFHNLPNIPFQGFLSPSPVSVDQGTTSGAVSLQPLTVRTAWHDNQLYFYLVNDAPYPIFANLTFSVSDSDPYSELQWHAIHADNLTHTWALDGKKQVHCQHHLGPYSFEAFKVSNPGVALLNVSVETSTAISDPKAALRQEIDRFRKNVQTMSRLGSRWEDPPNADFDMVGFDQESQESRRVQPVPHWTVFGNPQLKVASDTQRHATGQASMQMSGDADLKTRPGAVFSDAIPAPATGRLYCVFQVGIPAAAETLPLNVLLTAQQRVEHEDRPVYRSYPLAADWVAPLQQAAPSAGVRWCQAVVPFDRLPVDSLEEIRIGFELVDAGTVWIDNLRLFQLSFSRQETNELLILVNAADVRLESRRYSDLDSILNGYWAKFLREFSPLPDVQPAKDQGQRAYADKAAEKDNSSATKTATKKTGFLRSPWSR